MKKYITLLFISLAISLIHATTTANAADLSKFRAGNIMSDYVMSNKDSMSETQIQSFLTNKNSCQDRNISKANQYPNMRYSIKDGRFICLSEETFNGESAAKILWQAGQDYSINPQVLIVLLQKEQGLVTDTWPNHNIQYRSATGYGCPDNAPCEEKYYGFKNQVRNAANFFRAHLDNNPCWNKPHIPGSKKSYWKPQSNCNGAEATNNGVFYHPNESCGSTPLTIENRATSGLYSYTPYQPNQAALSAGYGSGNGCSSYGNRNFWNYFNDWFGSTIDPKIIECDSTQPDVTCVWGLTKRDGSHFLTSSKSELQNAINKYGWVYEGVILHAATKSIQNTHPVYRFQASGTHLYTADYGEYLSLKQSNEWTYEGIAFYAPQYTITGNDSHTLYRLRDNKSGHYVWTKDNNKKTALINDSHTLETNSFNSFSPSIPRIVAKNGYSNIYRLKNSLTYFYTSSLSEAESALKLGYIYEDVLTSFNSQRTGSPIYRLQRNGKYLYTANTTERDNAVKKYGYTYEGVGFYLDKGSLSIYRLYNSISGGYFYTSNLGEAIKIVNLDGWLYEGSLAEESQTNSIQIHRLVNLQSGRHLYSGDIKEIMKITNKNWQYEGVSFNANRYDGDPLYRLLSQDKHLYTSSNTEKESAKINFGYVYEGVAFYVNNTENSNPVYRLQGNGEYIYVTNTTERDNAVKKYGYTYEGVGFYLPL